MQSKLHSHIETFTNQIVGVALGWSIMYWVLPLIGIHSTPTQATYSSVIFFISSYTRTFVLRRIFNNWARKTNE